MAAALGSQPAAYPDAAQRDYSAAMERYSNAVAARVAKGGELEGIRLDLLELTEKYAPAARQMARRVAASARGEVARMAGLRKLQPVIREDAQAFIDQFARFQVELLKNNVNQQITKLGENRVASLPDADGLWVSRTRAQLIARTETQRLSNEIVAYWAQQYGSDEYIWVTAQDERVRHGHAALNGTHQRYDNPPEKNDGFGSGGPGTSPNCRCRPKPIF
jgi:SPP1 gp7 family putative phage head morphogenesis protein